VSGTACCCSLRDSPAVVRSSPANPNPCRRSWATSARTAPSDCSTSSSNLGRTGRSAWPAAPGSRSAHRRSLGDVTPHCLGVHPRNTAAECAHPVASNASRISMISLSDFFTVPPVRSARAWSETSSFAPEGHLIADRHDRPTRPQKGDQLSAEQEMNCPPTSDLGPPLRSECLGSGTAAFLPPEVMRLACASAPLPPCARSQTAARA